jgi:hypothetical protein
LRGEFTPIRRVLNVLRFSWRTGLRDEAIAVERLRIVMCKSGPAIWLHVLRMHVRITLHKGGRVFRGLGRIAGLSTTLHVHFVGVGVENEELSWVAEVVIRNRLAERI